MTDTIENDLVDAELLQIFAEEGQSIVANIGENLALWRINLADRDASSAIFRSFHTLKGDCRLVGQMELGDFVWRYEQLLNRILDGDLTPDQSIIVAVDDTQQWLASIFHAIDRFDSRDPALIALAQRAEALMNGQPLVAATVTEPTAAVEDAGLEEPSIEPAAPLQAHAEPQLELNRETVVPDLRRRRRPRVMLWVLLILLTLALAGYFSFIYFTT